MWAFEFLLDFLCILSLVKLRALDISKQFLHGFDLVAAKYATFYWRDFASKILLHFEISNFLQKYIKWPMSGVQILVLVKKFEKLSSVAYGWKNNVYNGTPCTYLCWSQILRILTTCHILKVFKFSELLFHRLLVGVMKFER